MWLRLLIQGVSILVLLSGVCGMLRSPLLWPFAAVLVLEAFWLFVSLWRAPRMSGGAAGIVASAVIAVYPALISWVCPGPYVEPVWRFGLSYVIQCLALALEVWAFLTLRSSLTQLPEAHRLVRSGPYRYVRHPLYVAYTLAFVGSCLGAMRWSLWGLLAGFIVLQWIRAKAEERVLVTEFPEYAAYARVTGRFIPKVTRRVSGGDS
ncbi:methyltransferase family protein [Alicyclobacillus macrosporangiidus]|uniref:Protein-S-isoprenylcysteine O-methyltransferase Ste14 n=1 Tax=Alicyclobacillus macrosporangiidus TaxID=392015 RepID=A0A1I7LI77_9BACL|nr:isoprenylcysteine carboxylmethyltransferase family protein [Alicyclobacillus macrosporangiidus]SFV09392.1 Protein-S-isoprenylcysteine O-methyltransferase Ste14 [Alicyclobacillus macrosporangiidus]